MPVADARGHRREAALAGWNRAALGVRLMLEFIGEILANARGLEGIDTLASTCVLLFFRIGGDHPGRVENVRLEPANASNPTRDEVGAYVPVFAENGLKSVGKANNNGPQRVRNRSAETTDRNFVRRLPAGWMCCAASGK